MTKATTTTATTTTARELVKAIHATAPLLVLEFAGAGVQALAWLHAVGGSSRTVLEATDRYAPRSLIEAVGFTPERFTSRRVGEALARHARARAQLLAPAAMPVFGVGSTATIATDRRKRGEHRCVVAVEDPFGLVSDELVLDKGARNRAGEEALVSWLILRAVAEASGVMPLPELPLRATEALERMFAPAPLLAAVAAGEAPLLLVRPDGALEGEPPRGAAVLSGSFNPVHRGHLELARVAGEWLGREVVFELPLVNADKAEIPVAEARRRAAQFLGVGPLLLSRAPLFVEKARLLPDTVFVVGADTAVRLVDPKYYGGDGERLAQVLDELRERGARFLVAARLFQGRLLTLADAVVPPAYAELFEQLPVERFRIDISSRQIRRRWRQGDEARSGEGIS